LNATIGTVYFLEIEQPADSKGLLKVVNPNTLSGWDWGFEFQELSGRSGLPNYATNTSSLFAHLADNWSSRVHTEWLLRQYLALKLIMAASIQFGSADYAYNHNVQMAVPYLSYYGIFNAMRANLLTSPRQIWGKRTLAVGHEKAREQYASELRLLLSADEVAEQEKIAIDAKHGRELMSYRFPSSGTPGKGGFYVYRDKAEQFARLAAELALFNSCCLAAQVRDRFEPPVGWEEFCVNADDLEAAWNHKLKGANGADVLFPDESDQYEIYRAAIRMDKPIPFTMLIGGGGVEDFFGSFVSTVDDDDEAFDPDEHWDRLLELP
jgi:hypothetical protein